MISIDTPVDAVPKISRRIIPALKRLGIKTVRDLLFHFPSRYEDFSNVKFIRDVAPNETVTVGGRIQKISTARTARKRMFITEAFITDDTGNIKAIWFNQPFLVRNLRSGDAVNLSGKAVVGKGGLYLQNPAYERSTKHEAPQHPDESGGTGQARSTELNRSPTSRGKSDFGGTLHTGGLIAIYPETQGITSRWLRYLIKIFIELRNKIPDPLPPETRVKYTLPDITQALFAIHFPQSPQEAKEAERRFAFEELLLLQLRALKERLQLKQYRAPAIPFDLDLVKQFVKSLPFPLTDAQRRSVWEILKDMEKPRPMNRLLEGDVGSGKTVVAAAAALLAARAGFGTAFMAPTEILARQHYETLQKVLAPFEIKIGLLTGSEKKSGADAQILVGTHALIQKNVRFGNPGLVIIDEQHRFGVDQRAALIRGQSAALVPHFLSMSATPIPRTLALTIYGDLDLSILDEMPKNRKQVITRIVKPGKREGAYQFIRDEVKKGRQVFVICPRIELGIRNYELGETTRTGQQKLLRAEVKTVKEEYKKLSENIFPDLHVGMLHGKMKPKEKEAVMRRFKDQETDILVSTSVVEVGVDVPNAAIMMIEGAERFGLAQLHQFRGRVGRGAEQSYCFLFPTEDGMITKRLHAVAEAKNGFELAEKDFEIRGPGDIFGTRQWGVAERVLKGLADPELVREVREEARELVKKSPDLSKYPGLEERLEAFEKTVHLE